MYKKLLLLFLIIAICFSVFTSVKAMTESEKQALINQIIAQIAVLQAELNRMIAAQGGTGTSGSNPSSWCHIFNVNMKYGDSGTEVSALQNAMQLQGLLSLTDNEIIGSFFGANTLSAVIKFQEKYKSEILTPAGLSRGTGTVASFTRAKLNKLYTCSSVVNPTNPSCNPNWQCSTWGVCATGQQIRSCIDYNKCGTTIGKPLEIQYCSATCTPNWKAGTWSQCYGNSQVRTVTDLNNCGITTGKPMETQACASGSNPNPTCTPNWQCTDWSSCLNNLRTKSCFDFNYCNTTLNKPTEAEYCSGSNPNPTCTSDWRCGSWDACTNNLQTRTCLDYNFCSTTNYSRTENQSCSGLNPNPTCNPIWQTGSWSTCVNGQQAREVWDENSCGTLNNKPATTQSCCSSVWVCDNWSPCSGSLQRRDCYDTKRCVVPTDIQETSRPCVCTPQWECGGWGTCENGQQSQTCLDTNYCGVNTDKPAETQTCCYPDWEYISTSACFEGKQYITYNDKNNCGVPYPNSQEQSCVVSKIDIKANGSDGPLNLPAGSYVNVNLTWSYVGSVYNCIASESWFGSKGSSGSEYTSSYVSPTLGSYEYKITCRYNDDGIVNYTSDSVTINYTEPIISMNINGSYYGPVEIYSGNTAVISWRAQNSISCEASGSWTGSKPAMGVEYTAPITSNKIYTLKCRDELGNEKSTSIVVNVK